MHLLSLVLPGLLLLGGVLGQTCDNGLPGVSKGDVCCVLECGDECGGTGCSTRGSGLTGDDCCTANINTNGILCVDSGAAPCLGPAGDDDASDDDGPPDTCIEGVPGILVSDVCCPNSCGTCAGAGCSQRDGGGDFTGGQACCGGGVRSLDRVCSADVGAPCVVVEEEEMCTADVAGILVSDVCCPNSCGTCAGAGCSQRDGGGDFTGGQACCGGGVRSLDRVCSADVGAPCVVVEETPAPTPAPVTEEMCTADVAGILVSDVCCPNSCGTCAGAGCSQRDGGGDFTGGQACCGGGVRSLDRVCSADVGAPCVVVEEEEMCTADVAGILAKDVCCPNSCGTCAGAGCSQRDGGGDFTGGQACCGGGVRSLDRVCSADVGAPCVVAEVNSCLDLTNEFTRCSPDYERSIELLLSNCGLTDADIASAAFEACLVNFGKDKILFLELDLNELTTFPVGALDGLVNLSLLDLEANNLKMLPSGAFDDVGTTMTTLYLDTNEITALPAGIFDELTALRSLFLDDNELTTLPAGLFDKLEALTELYLDGNPDLECLPTVPNSVTTLDVDGTFVSGECGCGLPDLCGEGGMCSAGDFGYTCDQM